VSEPTPEPESEPTLGSDLPDLRAVGITFDPDADFLHIDVGEAVGDFEALGLLLVATIRQYAICAGATLEYDSDDEDRD
jgi:hypothetical protein